MSATRLFEKIPFLKKLVRYDQESKKVVGFAKLPSELLQHSFAFLDFKEQATIKRVSKLFYALVEESNCYSDRLLLSPSESSVQVVLNGNTHQAIHRALLNDLKESKNQMINAHVQKWKQVAETSQCNRISLSKRAKAGIICFLLLIALGMADFKKDWGHVGESIRVAGLFFLSVFAFGILIGADAKCIGWCTKFKARCKAQSQLQELEEGLLHESKALPTNLS